MRFLKEFNNVHGILIHFKGDTPSPFHKQWGRCAIGKCGPGRAVVYGESGLLDSSVMLGNLGLWVTPHTSLKLRGRTAEFPRSDFNRQVMRFTRHTVKAKLYTLQG